MYRLIEALESGRVVLMDGAMGTELQRLGLQDGEPPELWNLTRCETVPEVHAAYLEAGAEVLVTNTFQANPDALARHRIQESHSDIWRAAIAHARIFDAARPIVLASVGPFSGGLNQFKAIWPHARRADGLLLETWSIDNLMPRLMPDPPVLVSFTFNRSVGPIRLAQAAKACAAHANGWACALGVNCGAEIDMDDMLEIVRFYRQETDLPIFIRPNAGTPRRTDQSWEYPRSPQYMADKLWPLLEAGVAMVGGCCGTTPAHIAAFRTVIDTWNK